MNLTCIDKVRAVHNENGIMTGFDVYDIMGYMLYTCSHPDGVFLNEMVGEICMYLEIHKLEFYHNEDSFGILTWCRIQALKPVQRANVTNEPVS